MGKQNVSETWKDKGHIAPTVPKFLRFFYAQEVMP